MRDIGDRIRRYRLSRYGSGSSGVRRLRWLWPLLAAWLVYAGLLGEHSWFHIWRLSRESESLERELRVKQGELARLEHVLHDSGARRELGEKVLRERDGFGRPNEIIYRIPARDSLAD